MTASTLVFTAETSDYEFDFDYGADIGPPNPSVRIALRHVELNGPKAIVVNHQHRIRVTVEDLGPER